jgi:hypothetical protein
MVWHRKNTNKKLVRDKLEIIDFALNSLAVRSVADLGGVWGVDGGYTFYTLDKYGLGRAVLADRYITSATKQQAKKHPQLSLLSGDFGSEHIVREIGQIDAIFLFDVLLHQVAPDWDHILELYAPQTRCFVIYNQQWIGSKNTVRLLDLGEDEYFRNVPVSRTERPYDMLFQTLDQEHPDQGKPWRDAQNIWQWGITDGALQSKVESLGFRLQFFKNCGQEWNTRNFENHACVFSR